MTAAARKAFDEAVALEQSGRVDKALVSYLKAQELSPDDTEIAYRTASALLQNGYLEEALSQLRRLVFAEPEHLNARASLGNCHLLLGDLLNAEQSFTDVLARAPENKNALFGLASVLLKEGRFLEALTPARQLVDMLPGNAAVLTVFAEAQAKTDQLAAAIATYRKALKSDIGYVPAITGLCHALLLRKRFDEVIELAIQACDIAPADPVPLELLSDALLGKGSLADAQEAAEAALKLDPKAVPNLVRLSIVCRKRSDFLAALKFALDAHDLDRGAKAPLNALGAALATMKYPLQARTVLTCLSSGKDLDAAVRTLIEGLIAEERHIAEAPPEEQQDRTPDGLETAAEEVGNGADDPPAPVDMPVDRGSILTAGDDDQLPNVLGLRRQDRS